MGMGAQDIGGSISMFIILRLADYFVPLRGMVLAGDADTTFAPGDRPVWNTGAIQTVFWLKLGDRMGFALIFINTLAAETGNYELSIGDCGGTVELVDPKTPNMIEKTGSGP